MEDFLSKMAKEAKAEIGEQSSPYRLNKESTRTVQMRESTYRRIKEMAYKNDDKMVDTIDKLIHYALDNGKF